MSDAWWLRTTCEDCRKGVEHMIDVAMAAERGDVAELVRERDALRSLNAYWRQAAKRAATELRRRVERTEAEAARETLETMLAGWEMAGSGLSADDAWAVGRTIHVLEMRGR